VGERMRSGGRAIGAVIGTGEPRGEATRGELLPAEARLAGLYADGSAIRFQSGASLASSSSHTISAP
jgi:hypothetical protein